MKANPGKYSIANPGIGTTPQLAAELFKLTYKLDTASVPFGGAGPAIQSAVGGHTPIAFSALPPTAPQVQGGKLRALAVTSAKRSATLPDVPTMAEAGIKGQESETMQGIFVAAGTPKEIVDLLNREIVKVDGVARREGEMRAARFRRGGEHARPSLPNTSRPTSRSGRGVIKEAKVPQIQ